ncbi:hypothetical protein SteCoe_22907 [Stentor coeruleus]|uniref:Uncharacterized protein n=1 Tax=Stentor coeruleus TaxID=5963 RepID=A0A1R2BL23_9CILI|nr:hypothetical protein SteCoe_22907 [Stentor coeruleus]
MSKKNLPADDDFQEILDKITQEKEERQKGLEDLKKRKKALDKMKTDQEHPRRPINTDSNYKPRQTLSSEREERNIKIYAHLQSPKYNETKSPKVKNFNRIEEQDLYSRMEALNKQKNKLKMLDKRARYAGLVREIFAPSIDQNKRQEIEARMGKTSNMTRSANNSRGNSLERDQNRMTNLDYENMASRGNLEIVESRTIQNAARATLESPKRGLGN